MSGKSGQNSFSAVGFLFSDRLLGQAIDSLVDSPEKGIAIEHIRKGYRLYHFEHHYVIYRLTSTLVDIVRVLGESMDIKRHL